MEDDWVDVGVKSLPAALSYIQSLVGLDFQAFVALTHITHSTVIEMTDNLSDSNLIKVLLDFGLIARFEKRAKEQLKEVTQLYDKKVIRKNEIENSLKLINTFKPVPTTDMYKTLAVLTSKASNLRNTIERSTDSLNARIREASINKRSIESELNKYKKMLSEPICPTCGCDILKSGTLSKEEIDSTIHRLTIDSNECDDIITLNEDRLQSIRDSFCIELQETNTEISVITNKIHTAEYNASVFESNKSEIKALKAELNSIEKDLPTYILNQTVLSKALSIFKKGVLQNEILEEFCKILNIHITEYLSYVSMDYISITTKPSKNSFEYIVMDSRYDSEIVFNELSGGELTRVRLVILLSVLKTINLMTGTGTNILIFDEALDTLDKTAAGDLARLFTHLVNNDDKFIAMVSHGEQLSEVNFRGTIKATKTNNVTVISQET